MATDDFHKNDQMLDLVTMEPKLAGELTAAEKYIIKSRLRSSISLSKCPNFQLAQSLLRNKGTI